MEFYISDWSVLILNVVESLMIIFLVEKDTSPI